MNEEKDKTPELVQEVKAEVMLGRTALAVIASSKYHISLDDAQIGIVCWEKWIMDNPDSIKDTDTLSQTHKAFMFAFALGMKKDTIMQEVIEEMKASATGQEAAPATPNREGFPA